MFLSFGFTAHGSEIWSAIGFLQSQEDLRQFATSVFLSQPCAESIWQGCCLNLQAYANKIEQLHRWWCANWLYCRCIYRCAVMRPCYIAGHTQWQIFRRGPCKRQPRTAHAQTTKTCCAAQFWWWIRAQLAPSETPRRRFEFRSFFQEGSLELPQKRFLLQSIRDLGCIVKVPNSYDAMKNPENSTTFLRPEYEACLGESGRFQISEPSQG